MGEKCLAKLNTCIKRNIMNEKTMIQEPELKAEYIEKAPKIMAQEALEVGTVRNLKKMISKF